MTTQIVSREDRLYVLATVLKQRELTPDSNLYKTIIVKVNAQTFHLPPARVDELTKILTSAYKADRWASILGEAPQDKQQIAVAVPKYTAPERSPRYDAMRLKQMARQDTFDGVGRLILKEVQFEVNLSAEEILQVWQAYNKKDTIEQSGSIFLIYWGGKDSVEDERDSQAPIVPPVKPELFRRLEYHPEENLEKGDFTADKETDGIGEVSEEEGDYTEAE